MLSLCFFFAALFTATTHHLLQQLQIVLHLGRGAAARATRAGDKALVSVRGEVALVLGLELLLFVLLCAAGQGAFLVVSVLQVQVLVLNLRTLR